MSKRLPRTSQQTLNDLRNTARDTLEEEKATALASAENSGSEAAAAGTNADGPKRRNPTEPDPAGHQNEAAATSGPDSEGAARKAVAPRTEGALTMPNHAAVSDNPIVMNKAAFLTSAGQLIVERHANFATVAGLIPLPWVDLAAITAIVDRMLRKLARLHGKRLDGERSKQLAAAMLTGMAAPGIASFTTTGLFRVTIGQHFIGSTITSISAAVLVRVVGKIYLTHLREEDSSPVINA